MNSIRIRIIWRLFCTGIRDQVDGVGDFGGHGFQVSHEEGVPDAVDGACEDEELGYEEQQLFEDAALVDL